VQGGFMLEDPEPPNELKEVDRAEYWRKRAEELDAAARELAQENRALRDELLALYRGLDPYGLKRE
jgi:hypothetical protein